MARHFLLALLFHSIHQITSLTMMTRGVGLFRSFKGSDTTSIQELVKQHVDASAKRATMVHYGNHVALVEEWNTEDDYNAAITSSGSSSSSLENKLAKLVSEEPFSEYFPHCLHICKPDSTKNDIGILVRQATTGDNGVKLRDAQREAYERQMPLEPGCTCCIILSGSPDNKHQVRIIELWKTMQDFQFHETSEWHALGEEKVVPLVVDMDCDFCKGNRLLSW